MNYDARYHYQVIAYTVQDDLSLKCKKEEIMDIFNTCSICLKILQMCYKCYVDYIKSDYEQNCMLRKAILNYRKKLEEL